MVRKPVNHQELLTNNRIYQQNKAFFSKTLAFAQKIVTFVELLS
jgi:hypothetical protein